MAVQNVPPLVGPVISLALWTFVMEFWLYSYRIPDIEKYKLDSSKPGWTREGLEKQIPPHRNWPAHNFNHLHEQPTVFYAVALSLTFLEASDSLTINLAWAYVGARVLHSLLQATTNKVMQRFSAFAVSSLVLFALTVKAAVIVFL